MRPCNQCRQPIENSQQLCAACEAQNRADGIVAKPPVSIRPYDANQAPRRWLETVNPLLALAAVSLATCMGTLGFVLMGTQGAMAGLAAALIATMVFASSLNG